MHEQPAHPERIGPFRILASIASGGMGSVFLATRRQADGSQQLALKILHAHLSEDAEVSHRFVDEARVGARITHPNVISVLDAGTVDGVAYLALQYVRGDTLAALLRASTHEPMPMAIASSIVLDVLAGLHAAHEVTGDDGSSLGIVHRDVSPQNVLVDLDGRAYITDFGIAKVKDSLRVTRDGATIGKAGYMAPEQVLGTNVTTRTDLYACGILLWECLTGRKLFAGASAQIQAAAKSLAQPRARAYRADVPEAIDGLLDQLLQHDPAARPASAFDVSERLRKALPRASRRAVGTWVRAIAGARLAERDRLALLEDQDDEQTVARPIGSLLPDATPPAPRATLPSVQAPPRSVLPPAREDDGVPTAVTPKEEPTKPSTLPVLHDESELDQSTQVMPFALPEATAPMLVAPLLRIKTPVITELPPPPEEKRPTESLPARPAGLALGVGLCVGACVLGGVIWLFASSGRSFAHRDTVPMASASAVRHAPAATPSLPTIPSTPAPATPHQGGHGTGPRTTAPRGSAAHPPVAHPPAAHWPTPRQKKK